MDEIAYLRGNEEALVYGKILDGFFGFFFFQWEFLKVIHGFVMVFWLTMEFFVYFSLFFLFCSRF